MFVIYETHSISLIFIRYYRSENVLLIDIQTKNCIFLIPVINNAIRNKYFSTYFDPFNWFGNSVIMKSVEISHLVRDNKF